MTDTQTDRQTDRLTFGLLGRLRFIKFSVPKNQELRLVLCPDVSLSKIYDLLQIIILNMFPPPLLAPVISYIFLYYNITIKHIWLELTFTILLRHSENKEIIKKVFLQLLHAFKVKGLFQMFSWVYPLNPCLFLIILTLASTFYQYFIFPNKNFVWLGYKKIY